MRMPKPGPKKRGPKPNLERRRQVAELRARWLTHKQVGERLGISHQRVQQLLAHPARGRPAAGVPCAKCRAQIMPQGGAGGTRGAALCLDCLAADPQAAFAQRLRTLRIAAGMTLADLAERGGLTASTIKAYERGMRGPRPRSLAKLVRVLGNGLAVSDPAQDP